jgi:acyl carrier protein
MKVEEFIQNELSKLVVGISQINFNNDTNSFMDLGLDSFGFIEFIQELERHYCLEFSNEDILNSSIYTPKGLRNFVELKLAAR